MLYAIYNGIKTEPQPNFRGKCPFCFDIVQSRCGRIKEWHWAHLRNYNCDLWQEHETEWHINWKKIFGLNNSEIIIIKNSVKHIADIYAKERVVIELQNSPICLDEIEKREQFYGDEMLWILNGEHFKKNFSTLYEEQIYDYKNIHWHHDDPDLFPLHKFRIPGKRPSFSYKWSWPRQSWTASKRNVFIDFGGKDLYWIKAGLGENYGSYNLVNKISFVEKYGGDCSLIPYK